MIMATDTPKIPLVEEGLYDAICTGVIDLGVQVNEVFQKTTPVVRLLFELVGVTYEMNEQERTRQVAREFTLSLGEKAHLRKFLESWRGTGFTSEQLNGFDMREVLGKVGQLQIIHKESEKGSYAVVNTMLPLSKSAKVPEADNPLIYFDMSDPETYAEYEMFPDFLRKKIAAAENFAETGLTPPKAEKEKTTGTAKRTVVKKQPKQEVDIVDLIDADDDLSFDIKAA